MTDVKEIMERKLKTQAEARQEIISLAVYENPVFTDPSYRRFRELCPVTEKACREQSLWITQDMLLGDEEDTRDICRAFRKVYEGRDRLA